MTRILRTMTLAASLLFLLCGPSSAEKIVQINPGPGRYDQPSAVSQGTTVHVAFIGTPSGSGPYSVYYAAVNGGSDFTNLTITKDSPGFMVTPAMKIDNTGVSGDTYYDARHPKIALQTATVVIIFFQAKPTSNAGDNSSLYRAQITLLNNAVSTVSVKAVSGIIPAGDVQDVSFGVVASDNTARLAYSVRPDSLTPFEVYYTRIGLDNGAVIRSPIKLSAFPKSNGSRPVPNLRLDGSNRAHIVWSADALASGTVDNAAIYYAMIKEFNSATLAVTENAAIAATRVIQATKRWGHPQVLVAATNLIHVLAADEPGAWMTLANLNPDAALQDNNSVNNLPTNNSFLLNPPGSNVLLPYSLYRPEAWLDLGGRIHMTGYGNANASPLYFAASPVTTNPYLNFLVAPTLVGFNEAGSFELPNDYTKASFAFLGGKGVVFWSGTDNTGTQIGTLNVTGLPTIAEFIIVNEKGCASVPGGRSNALFDLLCLVVPLAILKMRSVLKRGRVAA